MSTSTIRLNAPFGARCFLAEANNDTNAVSRLSLNAPFGARCFLAGDPSALTDAERTLVLMHLLALGAFWRGPRRGYPPGGGYPRLNAPFGARCFLAFRRIPCRWGWARVLMHLLALGAFWRGADRRVFRARGRRCLNAPFGARCFLADAMAKVERQFGKGRS